MLCLVYLNVRYLLIFGIHRSIVGPEQPSACADFAQSGTAREDQEEEDCEYIDMLCASSDRYRFEQMTRLEGRRVEGRPQNKREGRDKGKVGRDTETRARAQRSWSAVGPRRAS